MKPIDHHSISFYIDKAELLYNFNITEEKRLALLNEEELKNIKDIFKKFKTSNLNCIITNKQEKIENFLLSIGFKKIDSFYNRNTKNKLYMLSLNDNYSPNNDVDEFYDEDND